MQIQPEISHGVHPQSVADEASRQLTPNMARYTAAALIAVGIVLQMANWLDNRSLWNDELAIAFNLRQRSFAQLVRPMDYEQVAPIGFVLIEKSLLATLGRDEQVLRLFPLLCGVGSIVLANLFFKSWMTDIERLIALGLLVLQPRFIEYAAELKPYETDVLAALLVLLAYLYLQRSRFRSRALALFILSGIILPWISLPVMLVLGAAGIATLCTLARSRRWCLLAIVAGGCVTWIISAGTQLGLLRQAFHDPYLSTFWADQFMPHQSVGGAIAWTAHAWVKLFRDPFKGTYEWITAPVAAAGLVVLVIRHRSIGRLFAGILLLAVLAAGLHLYPLGDRLALYMMPMLAAWIAAIVALLANHRSRARQWAAGLLLAFVTADAFGRSAGNLVVPRYREESKTVLRKLALEARPGDTVYVFVFSHLSYQYYAGQYGLHLPTVIGWSAKPQGDPRLRELLMRRRVWLYFAHGWKMSQSAPSQDFQNYADSIARPAAKIIAPGAMAFLYEPLDSGDARK